MSLFHSSKPTYTAVTFFLVVGAFAFTWYSLRPAFFTGLCNRDAKRTAIALMQTKARVEGAGSSQQLADNNLYIKADYEFFFRTCMRENGFDR